MIAVKTVQTAVVTGLRSIVALVAAVGVAGAITGYDPEDAEYRTVAEALRAMEEGSLLVFVEGVTQALRGEIPRWSYDFRIAMFCPGDFTQTTNTGIHPGYFDLFQTIIDGIVPASGLRWLDAPVHDSFDPPDNARMERSQVDGVDTYHLAFSLIEIGG